MSLPSTSPRPPSSPRSTTTLKISGSVERESITVDTTNKVHFRSGNPEPETELDSDHINFGEQMFFPENLVFRQSYDVCVVDIIFILLSNRFCENLVRNETTDYFMWSRSYTAQAESINVRFYDFSIRAVT